MPYGWQNRLSFAWHGLGACDKDKSTIYIGLQCSTSIPKSQSAFSLVCNESQDFPRSAYFPRRATMERVGKQTIRNPGQNPLKIPPTPSKQMCQKLQAAHLRKTSVREAGPPRLKRWEKEERRRSRTPASSSGSGGTDTNAAMAATVGKSNASVEGNASPNSFPSRLASCANQTQSQHQAQGALRVNILHAHEID